MQSLPFHAITKRTLKIVFWKRPDQINIQLSGTQSQLAMKFTTKFFHNGSRPCSQKPANEPYFESADLIRK